VKYCVTAGGLGAGWFVVLLIPGITREWLLENPGQNLAGLVASSVLVALWCRRYIGRAETLGEHLLRAIVIPYLGCVVFLSLWAALFWARTLLFGGLASLYDTLSLYAIGMVAVTVSFYVVIPYGLWCQHVMSRAAFRKS
jgi:hypothetical protein